MPSSFFQSTEQYKERNPEATSSFLFYVLACLHFLLVLISFLLFLSVFLWF